MQMSATRKAVWLLLIGFAFLVLWGLAMVLRQPSPTTALPVRIGTVESAPKSDAPAAEAVAVEWRPILDLVRVEPNGQTMIAGKGAPNAPIEIMLGDTVAAALEIGADGTFVFFDQLPAFSDPSELFIRTASGATSEARVLVLPPATTTSADAGEDGANSAAVVVVADEAVAVQPPEVPPETRDLGLASIDYGDDGDVVIAGFGTENQQLRVYVDNVPMKLGAVEDGKWSFEIGGLAAGIYTLRVDQLDATGDVTARVESPFQRVFPDVTGPNITVQPGFTLWRLAEEKYGDGNRYAQIFAANKDQIKDPNLIYPGQIFDLPNE